MQRIIKANLKNKELIIPSGNDGILHVKYLQFNGTEHEVQNLTDNSDLGKVYYLTENEIDEAIRITNNILLDIDNIFK
jgi:hypothetical protein